MLTWSHYRFRQRLIHKAREYPGCRIMIIDEHYTSKTCGNCGTLHDKLGSNKSFQCPECHVEMDRDINAARNILLRFMTKQSASRDAKLRADSETGRRCGLPPHVAKRRRVQDFLHFDSDSD